MRINEMSDIQASYTLRNNSPGQKTYQHEVYSGRNQIKSYPQQGGENEQEFIKKIEEANNIQQGKTECKVSIHEDTHEIMIKIMDSTTKQVIQEIPSEQILNMVRDMCERAGLFIDEKR